MKKINLASLLILFIATFAYSQNKDEQQLAARVETLREALLSGNRTTLEEIAAPELSYGHSSGTIEDRAAFVEALASGKTDFTKIDPSDRTIKISGSTAWVRQKLHVELTTGSVDIGELLVWQKQKGKWVLLARQAYRI